METGFLDRTTGKMDYTVYVPRGSNGQGLPAMLFMHGSGECGTDGLKQSAVGLPQQIRFNHSRWPFLVVIPQKPTSARPWRDFQPELNEVLWEVEKEFSPSRDQRYITGLSQGGFGTFTLADHLTWTFAAAAPVCGWAEVEEALVEFKEIPIWAFHGGLDDVVLPGPAQKVIEALAQAGLEAKFTLFPEANHNSWDLAYGDSGLAEWFLEHRRDQKV